MNTILYLTDNTLEEGLALRVQKELIKAAQGKRIVSVSQKPIAFGDNVVVGEMGRNWIALYKQILAGVAAADTPTVAFAEHDCMYTAEHFGWIPPRDDVFYYNDNCWLVQWGGNHPELNGMYSRYWVKDGSDRCALSQLICYKDLLKQATEEILELLEDGLETRTGLRFHGEFGTPSREYIAKAQKWGKSGRAVQLQRYLKYYLPKYKSEMFKTVNPNLDIRHSTNFTGPKRGTDRTYDLRYWGDFKKVME